VNSWRDSTITSISTSSTRPARRRGQAGSALTRRLGGRSINEVDESQGLVYFSANEGAWRQANVYAVGLTGRISTACQGKRYHNVWAGEGEVLRGHLFG
jgi:hypothetical protein